MISSPASKSLLPGSRPGTRLVPQGPALRGAAFALDSMLVGGIVRLLPIGDAVSNQTLALVLLGSLLAYFAVLEGAFGTTAGKRVFGLRVVRAVDGRRCGVGAALVRTVMRLVDNVLFSVPGLVAITTSPRRQRYGDRLAKTIVVVEMPEAVLGFVDGLNAIVGAAGSQPQGGDASTVRVPAWPQSPAGAGAVPVLAPVVEAQMPCPFCDLPIGHDEVVCPHCAHYVNQVTAYEEAEQMAPVPMLYTDSRGLRFDALWRLVFADDEKSLAALATALAEWPVSDRLLAVQAFAEVDDRRPLAFLDLMARDPEPAVRALAREVRSRLLTRAGEASAPIR